MIYWLVVYVHRLILWMKAQVSTPRKAGWQTHFHSNALTPRYLPRHMTRQQASAGEFSSMTGDSQAWRVTQTRRYFRGNARVAIWFRLSAGSFIAEQGCQFGFFEAKFVIFGLFSTPSAFFLFLKKGQIKFGFFWPHIIFMSIWQI